MLHSIVSKIILFIHKFVSIFHNYVKYVYALFLLQQRTLLLEMFVYRTINLMTLYNFSSESGVLELYLDVF